MSQVANPSVDSDTVEFEQVGTGLNVYESADVVEGVVRWLETPEDVISFVDGDADVSDVIVVSRGGTTTFLTMALNAGVRGVVTLQGAPESHLGILCREYGIPCVMAVAFEKGVRTKRGETIPADGVRIRLDVSSRPHGLVSVEAGAPVDDSPRQEAAPGMSEEQMAQIMALLANFLGEIPHGSEGDKIMQDEMNTRVLFADADSLHRELSIAEVNEAIRYYTWNEWDALSARATEGESGLIPRQEYEAMGIMNCWFKHPGWLAAIQERVGDDGMIAIGDTARHEVGTKINMLHLWALATATSFGRGIALELNLHDRDYKADLVRTTFEKVRRLYAGLWGEGNPFLSSMQSYQAPILERSWIDRFAADRIAIDDDATRSAFLRFNGSAELMGFLLHFDNRLGLGDTGPYPTDDGGFVLVRDLFVNEPAFPWSEETQGLPYAFTIAMFFGPDSGVDVALNDLSTVFTTPANYLPHVTGVSVYSRETWDTPIEDLKTLSVADMTAMRDRCEKQSAKLYGRIAAMSKREKIEAGAMVYTAGFALPVARAAGMYDELVADHGFLEIHPAVSACYETIISGVATELIPRLFLTGSWGNPVPDTATESLAADDAELAVLHALRVCGFADTDRVADSSGLDADRVAEVLAGTSERAHTKSREGRVSGHTLTPAGRSRHVLLLNDSLDKATTSAVTAAYDRFLKPNAAFKQLTTDSQTGADPADVASRLTYVHGDVTSLLTELSGTAPRFGRYTDRLSAALDRYASGDASALARPMSGSYHDVWMELHEDLLATLGRERTDEDG